MPRKNPHAVALGRLGGRVSSPAKTRAVRRNARKGGRPPKFTIGDRVRVNGQAPLDFRNRVGRVARVGPGRNEYKVAFADGGHAYGFLRSWWLDRA